MASIYKRGKTWTYRVNYYDDNHTRHSKTKGGYSTKREAEIAAREIETNKDKGFSIDNKNISFADYFKEWFEIYKKGKVVAGRVRLYMSAYNKIHLYFKFTPLNSITRSDYQKFVNNLSEELKYSSIQQYHSVIKSAVRDAVQEGIIFKDFTYRIEFKKNKIIPKQQVLSKTEYFNLIDYLEAHLTEKSNLAFYVAAKTGMRIVEVFGLNWEDIDFENNFIAVNKIYDFNSGTYENRTKTVSSNRMIPLGKDTKVCLLAIKETGHITRALSHKTVIDRFKSLLSFLNIDTNFTPHKLRHTYASYLINEGVDISYVSKILGHANIGMTMRVYQHVLEERAKKEVQKIMSLM
ncbi:tyrosine-type recombinase/integrase [Lactobacillus terrae]|uniref:site-specific integrase n=1 Tax=Lactobacillus terrae TaxID=2269374 RepID=UPI000C1B7B5F|nr:tyrosine-type recombinase/integrase [Lactobacillus terrae]